MYAYKLKFNAPLHLGTDSEGQESIETVLHSDTIYNAIIMNWSLLFSENPEDLSLKPKFKISSAFPFIGNTLYFPLPVGAFDSIMKEETRDIKKWKRIDYIPESLLKVYLKRNSKDFSEKDAQFFEEHLKKTGKGHFTDKNKLYYGSKTERPRVSIDRLTGTDREGEFFYSSDFYFKNDSGLFFLVNFEDEADKAKFDSALTLLGDNGIGGDRSVGKGCFTFQVEKKDFTLASEKDDALLLSLYYPSLTEIEKGLLDNSLYTLIERSGHAGSYQVASLRKDKLRMLGEGSLLSKGFRSGGAAVKVIDMEKSENAVHNVFRNGLGFLLKKGE